MSLNLVRKLNSPRASVRRKAAAALAALNAKATSANVTVTVAAAAAEKAENLRGVLLSVQAVTGGVKVPNGTTKRIHRIVSDALVAA